MTAVTSTARTSGGALRRIGKVVRLQFVNPWTLLFQPWLVLVILYGATLAIWGLIVFSTRSPLDEGSQFTGTLNYFFVYMAIAGVLCMSRGFTFAVGMSVTRRDYYLGTAGAFVIVAAVDAVLSTLISLLEQATNGWGLGGRLFAAFYFGANPGERLFVFFAGLLFLLFTGASIAGVYMRWRITGTLVLSAVTLVVVLGAAALVTFTQSWPAVGEWFVHAGAVGVVGCLSVGTIIAAGTGFFVLRGATPKN